MKTGQTIYRVLAIIAGVVVAFAVVNAIYGATLGQPTFPLAALLLAALMYAIGWFLRYILPL
jgi:formate/nitrite transporter FocA (FNT family)